MYDSTNVAAIPPTANLILVYVDGLYQTEDAARARFPTAELITTTTTFVGQPGARIYDCERGDGNATQAAAWAERELFSKRRPTIYCSRIGSPGYGWQWVKEALQAANIPLLDVDFGIADYTNTPHLVPGSAFTQYVNPPRSGGDYDISLTNGVWPNAPDPVLTKPACAIMATSTGKGYWIVSQDGGVFSYGDAQFKGSLPSLGITPAQPIVDADSVGTDGYWLLGMDGGIFSFGSAPFEGSANK
jgi:hypothetical protein